MVLHKYDLSEGYRAGIVSGGVAGPWPTLAPFRSASAAETRRTKARREPPGRSRRACPRRRRCRATCAHWRPAPVASTSGSTPRMKTKEVIRIGRNRIVRRFDGRLEDALAGSSALAGHLDDQDPILGGEGDQEDQSDLRCRCCSPGQAPAARDRAQQCQRHRQDDGPRRDPAFVLAGEDEIDQQNPQREDEVGRAAHQLFLVGHRGPFGTHSRRQDRGDGSPSPPAPAGAEARRGGPLIVAVGKRL